MLKTFICELLGIEYPIIQGGMTYLAGAELVSAVSNAGGLGVIGTSNTQTDWIKEQISLTRLLTDKPFGINIMLMSAFLEEIVGVILDERVPVVTTGGGDPGVYVTELKRAGLTVMPIISTVAQAKRLEELGVDAVIAEGMESGGHIGKTTTMALVPQVVDNVKVPVVAAGGIADGRELAAALALGAQGVQIGTRFICAEECIAHPNFKEKILTSSDYDTTVIEESTGHPMRCLENKMTQRLSAMERDGASSEELGQLSAGKFYSGMIEGDVNDGLLMAGQDVGLIKEIKPVKEIIEQLVAEAEAVIAKLDTTVS